MSDNKKYKDDSYRDWLKRRNHLNNEVMQKRKSKASKLLLAWVNRYQE